MASRIEPVIGVRGTRALLERTLYITSKSFPWLARVGHQESSIHLLADLKACLENCDTNDATEASCELLITFTELLASLIGDPFTGRLLSGPWIPMHLRPCWHQVKTTEHPNGIWRATGPTPCRSPWKKGPEKHGSRSDSMGVKNHRIKKS